MMPHIDLNLIVTIICSVLASSGLWAYLMNHQDKNNAEAEMLKGLGHDRICCLCGEYIKRGWVSTAEYDDLIKYLYDPYKKLNGNGSAERLVNQVAKLPNTPPLTSINEKERLCQ